MSAIVVEHLNKSYAGSGETRQILRDLNLSIEPGHAVAIMGPSGSGKSTLLNIVGTLDAPTSGSVRLFGSDPFALDERALALFRNKNIGFIFQAHHLLPQCSIYENVLVPAIVSRGAARTESAESRAQRLLERVGLTSRMHARPGQCSGGECQRAAVVRALINAPGILLADEPTGSLDAHSAEAIGALLNELKREENLALLVVTHSLDLAKRMDAVLNLRDGALA